MVETEALNLSKAQARKLAILAQGLHRPSMFGTGEQGSLNALKHLGYVQIDTISVVERAHHHTFWNRNKSFKQEHIDHLQRRGDLFEYWSHAAAYLPMRDFRFSLLRKKAYADGDRHWHAKDPKVAKRVLQRIQQEGPLQARDFDEKRIHQHAWGGMKPAKIALERLFMEGELMIVERQGFQKVFDLTERALPSGVDTSEPTEQEFCAHLINSYLRANAFGSVAEFAYLRKGIKPVIKQVCQQMLEAGELIQVNLEQQRYYALPDLLAELATPLSRTKVAILSPFDNLVIQRKRVQQLFDFDYQIECYVPAAKRQYGYFCLPLLWGQQLVGRLDAKIDRKTGQLSLHHLSVETPHLSEFAQALRDSLTEFLRFNGGQSIRLGQVSSPLENLKQKDLDAIKHLLV